MKIILKILKALSIIIILINCSEYNIQYKQLPSYYPGIAYPQYDPRPQYKIFETEGFAFFPEWYPSGERVFFVYNEYRFGNRYSISSIRPDGSDFRKHYTYEGNERGIDQLSVSNDGYILFGIVMNSYINDDMYYYYPDETPVNIDIKCEYYDVYGSIYNRYNIAYVGVFGEEHWKYIYI